MKNSPSKNYAVIAHRQATDSLWQGRGHQVHKGQGKEELPPQSLLEPIVRRAHAKGRERERKGISCPQGLTGPNEFIGENNK